MKEKKSDYTVSRLAATGKFISLQQVKGTLPIEVKLPNDTISQIEYIIQDTA